MAEKSTRDHLIDVGLELMHENGYNATGISEILKAADVPRLVLPPAKRCCGPSEIHRARGCACLLVGSAAR